MLARIGERVLSWIALAGVVAVGIAIYQMPAETKSAIWSGAWRSALWVVIAAGLPWSAWLYIGRVLELGANWAGVALIAALTLLDALVGVGLMTAWPGSPWSWFAALATLVVAGAYNYLVAEYLAEMHG